MARRFSAPYHTEPVSALATWARRLAVFAAVAAVVSIIIVRFGFLEVRPALATFFGALACAGLSILVGLAAFVAIWQNGSPRTRRRPPAALLYRAALRRWRACAPATAPPPRSRGPCIPPSCSAPPGPTSSRSTSTYRCS